jgi:response regulator RpfG family c-di-GMP phosphodiesterase
MTQKVLFVDDDPNALATFQRNLRKQFDIETALGGEQGLQAINNQGPFAVIVSDLRMPAMDGIQFLTVAKMRAPDSVCIMLTGYVDLQTALEAVNEGIVFRFLVKPCPHDVIVKAVEAGVEQYQLVTGKRALQENTLGSVVEALTATLNLVNPGAFNHATRVRRYVGDIAEQLQLSNQWQLEVAAMLSQLGCVTLSPNLLDKIAAGERLTDNEQEAYSSHPSVGSKLVAHIPQLEPIARMIEGQQRPLNSYAVLPASVQERDIALGAQILRVAIDLDRMVTSGMSPKTVLVKLSTRTDEYNQEVVAALARGKGLLAAFKPHGVSGA